MGRSRALLFLTIIEVTLLWAKELTEPFSRAFDNSGYSAECVNSALSSCKLSSKSRFTESVLESLSVIIASLQEINLMQSHRPRNCAEIRDHGDCTSGVRRIYPYSRSVDKPVIVYCDQYTDRGGWTIIQNRDALPIREDFYRNWEEYVLGFGNITGEFWLGLDNIHALGCPSQMELRVDLEDYEGNKRWAKYGVFQIGDAISKYTLSIANYSGDAGDGAIDPAEINGRMFSTKDQDNDSYQGNCAIKHRGAWWYNKCHFANLNGYQYVGHHHSNSDGINWNPFWGAHYSLKKASMKVRPIV